MEKEVERYKAICGEMLWMYENCEKVREYLRRRGLDADKQLVYGRAWVASAFGGKSSGGSDVNVTTHYDHSGS